MLPSSKPWEEDNPATCTGCDGCDFCDNLGIIPRWVVEQWKEQGT